MWNAVSPSDTQDPLQTGDMKALELLEMSPVVCPALSSVKKGRDAHSLIHFNFGLQIQLPVLKDSVSQSAE